MCSTYEDYLVNSWYLLEDAGISGSTHLPIRVGASTQILSTSTSTLLSMSTSTSTEKMCEYEYFNLSTSTSTSYPKY